MTEPIKAIIVDDEAPAREVIKTYLQDFPEIQLAAECDNGFEAVKRVQQEKPHLLFLDIQMPKLTGFELLELLEDPPVVIFSTAYDQFALKAFEVSAADYLLKPYTKERFRKAVHRAMKSLGNPLTARKVARDVLQHRQEMQPYLERVVAKDEDSIFIIPVEKLYWLEAQGDYVMLHTKDGRFLKQQTMNYFENHLDPGLFVRIHRSHIVKLNIIKQLQQLGKETYRVVLQNGQHLPVSKSGRVRLKKLLGGTAR